MTNTEDREKLGLSLCPFCGGAARFGKCVPGEQEGENDGAEYVECCDCGASTCLVFPLMDSAKQVLRDMWNRRPCQTALHPNLSQRSLGYEIIVRKSIGACHTV